jgi:hypothetical protein
MRWVAETGGVLPGVTVELRGSGEPLETVTDAEGRYSFDRVLPGAYQLTMRLINFADVTKRDVVVTDEPVTDDEIKGHDAAELGSRVQPGRALD